MAKAIKKRKPGRKTKLTTETQERLCNLITQGFDICRAAELSGIGRSTFFKWRDKAAVAKSGIYKEFGDALKEADAQHEAFLISNINKAIKGGQVTEEEVIEKDGAGNITKRKITRKETVPSWHACAWKAERKYPERWALRNVYDTSEENKPLPWSDDGIEPVDPLGEHTNKK